MAEVTLTLTEGYEENWYRIFINGSNFKSVLYFTHESDEEKEKAKQKALKAFEEAKWSIAHPSVTKILLQETI